MVSVGTEIAPLRKDPGDAEESTSIERAKSTLSLGGRYLKKAILDPEKAARRVKAIAQKQFAKLMPQRPAPKKEDIKASAIEWSRCDAKTFETKNGTLDLLTDASEWAYQASSQAISITEGYIPIVQVEGTVSEGAISIGLLNERKDAWLGNRSYENETFSDQIIFDPKDSKQVTLILSNGGSKKEISVALSKAEIVLTPKPQDGLPLSEMEDFGWNVGYSASGEVIALGQGVTDLKIGQRVACGGAGKANHADYVCVPRNLVAPVPRDCSLKEAASTTIGTIALQGVRRAEPQLGEKVCLIGLGLLGQITQQLLQANGCQVIGLDLDPSRVERARKHGLQAGASDPLAFEVLVRDLTQGFGADRTIITAATKSSSVVNLAMNVTRRKGKVVVVGDVGLDIERPIFYKKEIDLLMSTSYGPGRYDASYELEGHDYPYAYVRWTLNRNMEAYMDAIASKKLDIASLIDLEIGIDEAPEAYKALASDGEALPLGVLLSYPDDLRDLPEAPEAKSITLRGHRICPDGPARYALVGAGAFGTCMLVPQMKKRKDLFFLRGVVSRNATQGGNFVRTHQVEVFSSDMSELLKDPDFDLMVISTRHQEHASQTVDCLKAGKHVFVEKPLALNWAELDQISQTYNELESPPLLMVGFNRRFSPAMQNLHKTLANRRTPLVVNYRLNGGYIPLDHWVQGPQGGGRNIGEACHMYDVFRFLAGSAVQSINASSIDPGALPYLKSDNFCATMTYEDGSVGNLTYIALGPKKGLPKERIEVFCDGEAYIIDDFKSLTRASDGVILWQSDEADKGHYEELTRLGIAIQQGSPAPIAFEEIIETTAVSLHIEDMLIRS
ncbi:MAG: Gfo/Idh/MocA family oxidoreductase [Candidatus Nitrohelix vancouverensis]|uniref:Gfo/Idh/MocA family oxidoreductase n=1 Tax=Candidatus Nitrohelix vancouverensis TaxID=2705534 RepID=A0A7T0C570_9BACT|nr:MAG: Gfo/Idh/MocA family oxidoreductase [Candidatus Nitrohelix vancouverensis]